MSSVSATTTRFLTLEGRMWAVHSFGSSGACRPDVDDIPVFDRSNWDEVPRHVMFAHQWRWSRHARPALLAQGVPLHLLDELEDGEGNIRSKNGRVEYEVEKQVEAIARGYFTQAVQAILDLPYLERVAAMSSEGLDYFALSKFRRGTIDQDVADELIKRGIASYDNIRYTTKLLDELGALHFERAESYWPGTDTLENIFYTYLPPAAWKAFDELDTWLYSDIANDIEESQIKMHEEDPERYAENCYQRDLDDTYNRFWNVVYAMLQPGIERRIFLEMHQGTANYTPTEIIMLERWGFVSKATSKVLQGIFGKET